MDENQRLHSKRRGLRGSVTKLSTKVEDIISTDLEGISKESVSESRKLMAATTLAQLRTKRDQIAELDIAIAGKIETEAEFEEETINADTYHFSLEEKIAFLTEFVRKAGLPPHRPSPPLVSSTPALPPTSEVDSSIVVPSETTTHTEPVHVSPSDTHTHDTVATPHTFQNVSRLPKLLLPTFSGDPLQWQTFWDSFNAAINSNPSLSGVQKFNYLRTQLHGDAARVIAGFPLTDLNYEHSVTLLKERFGQSYKLVNAHMEALLNLGKPSNSLSGLQAFYDSIEKHMRALSSLGKSSDSYGSLLTSSILAKLPIETKKHMAREHGNIEWNIDDVLAGTLKEIQILEMSQCTGKSMSLDNTMPTTGTFHASTERTSRGHDEQQKKEPMCVFCKGNHKPIKCNKVIDPKERLAIVRRDNLCYNCLAKHKAAQCHSKFTCRECRKRHHTSLCHAFVVSDVQSPPINNPPQPVNTVQASTQQPSPETSLTTMTPLSAHYTSVCLLKTAIATVSSDTVTAAGNILFDEGAQRSFVTQQLANHLHLQPTHRETVSVSSFGAQVSSPNSLEVTTLFVRTLSGNHIPISVLIVPKLAAPIRNSVRTCLKDLPYLKDLPLAHPVTSDENFDISVLIGADFYWQFVQDHIVRGKGPTAVQSHLGYLLSGPLPLSRPMETTNLHIAILSCTNAAEGTEAFWESESIGTLPIGQTPDDIFLRQYMHTHITTQPDGKYSLRFPWKETHPPLPSNYAICSKRTRSLALRLAKTPGLLKMYGGIIEEQEKRGFIEKVNNISDQHDVHYIPHHPVRKDSTTTPIRIVYDCSCKQSPDAPSLNDCLHPGPPFLNDLCAILLRFRQHNFAFSADIEKAFLHIYLDKADRDSTRFLSLSNHMDEHSPFVTYRFRVVLFGATSSPFMLNAALTFHLTKYASPVSKDLLNNLYVDNVLSGCATKPAVLDFFNKSRSLLGSAGFNLRSWSSNCSDLQALASKQHVSESSNPVKVLGVYWDTKSDQLFLSPCIATTTLPITTKREILRWSSGIFDPLGFISPVTIRAKLFLQQLWQEHVNWDSPLNTELSTEWHTIAVNITDAATFPLSRKYAACVPLSKITKTVLHVFADASLKAYGAAAYLQQNNQPASFVMSKSRAAPLKPITLPKLELMAAVLAARLSNFVRTSLSVNCTIYLWSDSQIVLYWIASQKKLKPFVDHRVSEIRSISTNWKYCPSADNPADLLTRGLSAQQLASAVLWQQGPSWLPFHDQWPTWDRSSEALLTHLQEELDNNSIEQILAHCAHTSPFKFSNVMDISKYSSLQRLLAVTAYVFRFVNTTRQLCHSTGHLTPSELSKAKLKWLHTIQKEVFPEEIANLKSQSDNRLSLVRQLRLFLDDKELLRCGGRIHNAPLSELTKFPYLLPSKHHFTKLIILHTHIQQHHSGVNATLTTIRQQYWIPSGRQRIRSLLRTCVVCKKTAGRPYPAPDPPPLVKCRVDTAHPFEVTGVDFTGALYVRCSAGEQKVYVCLFTCAVSRAVHLEIVIDLTLECFLQAFRRFTSRRSLPRVMMSDNATTFLAAGEELQSLLSSAALADNLARRGVEWRFIPKRAPWFGGFWERLIGLTKSAMKRVLGRTHATLESLRTLVTEVEAVLNNRPITYSSPDVDDPCPITPAHLLYGRPIVTLPHYDVTTDEITDPTYSDDTEVRRRAKAQAAILNHFWSRWSKEYLTALREFHRTTGNNVQTASVGDVVQIHDDSPRIQWRLGVIEQLNKGADGFVRSVQLRTSTGKTNRPITKLYPLEITAADRPQLSHDDTGQQVTSRSGNNTFRPNRQAAVRGRERTRGWINTLWAPPEDVED